MSKKQKPESQASFIRSRLAKKAGVETILAECEKRFPKGRVTAGYINWLAKRAPKAKAAKTAKKDRPARRIDGTVDEHLA